MKLGNLNLSDIKLGTQQVKKVIFGNNLVWQSISYIIQEFKTRVFAIQGEFEAETCMNTQLTDLDNKGLLDSASFVLTPNAYEENLLFAVKPDKVGTNLLLQSEGFTQAAWVLLGSPNVTRTANAGTSPIETNNATLLTNNSTSTFGIRQSVTISPNTQYVFSCWVRSDNPTEIRVDISDLNVTSFNLTNTWQRIQVLGTYNNSYAANLQFVDIVFGPNQLGSSFFIWGAQLELGSTATDYISTTDRAIINGTIGDLTVTRATLGTRVNADGDIEQVPYNYYSFSEQFDNSYWNKGDGSGTRVTVNPNQAIAPDGNMTADLLIPTTTLIEHSINATIFANTLLSSVALANLLTFSVYVKPAGYNFFIMRNNINNIWTSGVIFNIQTGTIVSAHPSYVSSNITSVGDGWYRLSVTTQNVTNTIFQMFSSPTGAITFSGDGVSGAYIWGAQLVQGTQPRDYFPTTNRFNIPRIDYSNGSCPTILVEQATSNQIRNNTMVGAVVGNPGTLPTNWTTALSGLASQVIGLGVEKGIEYIDIRISGTATSTLQRIRLETTTQIVAANGQTWTLSSYLRVITEPQPPTNYRLRMFENDSSGNFITGGAVDIFPTTSFARYSFTRTLSGGATVARVLPMLEFFVVSGQSYDFTIRVYGPQMQQLAFATSLIQTSTGAVTKNADVIDNTNMSTLIGQTEGAMFVDFNYERFNPQVDSFIVSISNGVISNSLIFAVLTNGVFVTNLRTSGSIVLQNIIPAASFTFGRKKILLSYKSGETNLYVNGVKIGSTNTSAFTFPVTINKFNLGSSWSGGSLANNTINSAALWKTTLTDAQAIQLTTL